MGRARIEQQKQTQLANIETRRIENLKRLNIEHETKDKVAKSIGYIGIAFLVVLFGSIFLNDFIKLCIYYWNGLREWWREKKGHEEKKVEAATDHVRLEMDQEYSSELEEALERVYFKIVKVNRENRRINESSN